MDDEIRKAFTDARYENRAALAKIDYWFEKNEAEHARTRSEIAGVRQEVVEVRQEVVEVRQDLASLKAEFNRFRDWVSAQFLDMRSTMRDLTARFEAMG